MEPFLGLGPCTKTKIKKASRACTYSFLSDLGSSCDVNSSLVFSCSWELTLQLDLSIVLDYNLELWTKWNPAPGKILFVILSQPQKWNWYIHIELLRSSQTFSSTLYQLQSKEEAESWSCCQAVQKTLAGLMYTIEFSFFSWFKG